MENDDPEVISYSENLEHVTNVSCNSEYVPTATEFIENLGVFGIIFVSLGTILTSITLYLALHGTYATLFMNESKDWKRNVFIILYVYPIASLCSLLALALPRAQLLSEAITQIYLTISLYRLYLLLIDVGEREVKKSSPLKIRVGPCCCWPCLPLPDVQTSPNNLSWIKMIVLQLPIVQTLVYSVFSFMSMDSCLLVKKYDVFLQPLSITSILLGLYGLTITVTSLQEISLGKNLRHKTVVLQMVLLFSKLQGLIIKNLPKTGLFPCDPPISPQVYANFTYNALMLIEMLLLGYAARHVYAVYRPTNADELEISCAYGSNGGGTVTGPVRPQRRNGFGIATTTTTTTTTTTREDRRILPTVSSVFATCAQ